MAYFPFFIDIEGKRGLIVGGGRIAEHKVAKLLPFGVKLDIVAPKIRDSISGDDRVTCYEREFRDSDVEGKLFVVAATDDGSLNDRVSRLCRERGILVNVVDDKEKCGFLFPAIVKEGGLTVGVSTGGASPQMAVDIRNILEENLPVHLAEILDYLEKLREPVRNGIDTPGARAAFYKEAAGLCRSEDRILTSEETEALLQKYRRQSQKEGSGCHSKK